MPSTSPSTAACPPDGSKTYKISYTEDLTDPAEVSASVLIPAAIRPPARASGCSTTRGWFNLARCGRSATGHPAWRKSAGRRGRWRLLLRTSLAGVLVVAAHPHRGRVPFVTAERGAVEEAVVAHHELQPAGGCRVGQADGCVLQRVGAHHRRLRQVGGGLGSALLGVFGDERGDAAGQPLAGGFLRAGDLEVEVVVALAGGGPREAPPHPPLVGLQLAQRRPRDAGERHIPGVQVGRGAVEGIGHRRADRTARRIGRAEHEVVDDQLGAPVEQLCQRLVSLVGVEAVLLFDRQPRQVAPLGGELVAAAGQFLLLGEQLVAGGMPPFTCSGLVTGHWLSPSCRCNCLARPAPPMTCHIGGVSPGTDEGARMIQIPSPVIASASGTSMAALAGRSFWARTRTAITDIQVMLMTPSATSISISPMLEPAQHSPNSHPEPTLARQRRRKCRLSGVNSYTPAAIAAAAAAKAPCGWYTAYTATPTSAQTAR